VFRLDGNNRAMSNKPRTIRRGMERTRTDVAVYFTSHGWARRVRTVIVRCAPQPALGVCVTAARLSSWVRIARSVAFGFVEK
jgi:hypothetical protein